MCPMRSTPSDIATLKAHADAVNFAAGIALCATGRQKAAVDTFLLRSHLPPIGSGEIPRQLFSSPLLASGHFAATLFWPVFTRAQP